MIVFCSTNKLVRRYIAKKKSKTAFGVFIMNSIIALSLVYLFHVFTFRIKCNGKPFSGAFVVSMW